MRMLGNLFAKKSTLEKAVIDVLEGDNKGKIKVMYNPEEYSNPISAEWKNNKVGQLEFEATSYDDLTLSLVYDKYEEQKDVRKGNDGTEKISNLTKPVVKGKKRKRPPLCNFIWGRFKYKGVVTKVDQKFTLFKSDGTPLRAKLTVTIKKYLTVKEINKLKGVSSSRKFYTVRMGDRLDLIAQDQLFNASLWPVIAHANNIDDPLMFPQDSDLGRTLIIPHLENE